MITLIRTATLMPGKQVEARAWASEIGGVVARITGNTCRVGTRIGGNPNDICWILQFDSLGQLEEQMPAFATLDVPASGNARPRVDQLHGIEHTGAVLTLITPRGLIAAIGAGTDHVPIG